MRDSGIPLSAGIQLKEAPSKHWNSESSHPLTKLIRLWPDSYLSKRRRAAVKAALRQRIALQTAANNR